MATTLLSHCCYDKEKKWWRLSGWNEPWCLWFQKQSFIYFRHICEFFYFFLLKIKNPSIVSNTEQSCSNSSSSLNTVSLVISSPVTLLEWLFRKHGCSGAQLCSCSLCSLTSACPPVRLLWARSMKGKSCSNGEFTKIKKVNWIHFLHHHLSSLAWKWCMQKSKQKRQQQSITEMYRQQMFGQLYYLCSLYSKCF